MLGFREHSEHGGGGSSNSRESVRKVDQGNLWHHRPTVREELNKEPEWSSKKEELKAEELAAEAPKAEEQAAEFQKKLKAEEPAAEAPKAEEQAAKFQEEKSAGGGGGRRWPRKVTSKAEELAAEAMKIKE